MPCRLHDLDRGHVTLVRLDAFREGNSGQADCAVVRIVRRACQVEHGDHDGRVIGGLLSETNVDVHESALVAAVETGLDGDGTAVQGPVGSVLGDVETAA